ncbi:MAG: DUF5011 domain-containing protein, partial [Eggerthellaceae bacterium]|nr:DUF5011 domain-containing protein [Eggerthellaceae bacterium]
MSLALTMGAPMSVFADDTPVAPGLDLVEYKDLTGQDATADPGGAEGAYGSDDGAFAGGSGEEGFISIMPLAVTDLGPGECEVDTWADLISAMNNTAYTTIYLNDDITRTAALPAVTRDLTIDGRGHTMNFNNDSAIAFSLTGTAVVTFTLANVDISNTGSSANYFINTTIANKTINIDNLTGVGTVNRPFVNARTAGSTVTVTGKTTWDAGNNQRQLVNARFLVFTGPDTEAKFTSGNNPVMNIGLAGNASGVSVLDGAVAEISNYRGAGVTVIDMQNGVTAGTSNWLKVYDASKFDVIGSGNDGGASAGVIIMEAAPNQGGVEVRGGSEFNIISLNAMNCFLAEMTGGRFLADGEGTKLNFQCWGGASVLSACIRFRALQNQYFIASNKADITIKVNRHTQTYGVSAVRFPTGGNSGFIANTGATIHIYNEGNGSVATSDSGDGNNYGVEFNGNTWDFSVTGPGTAVEIYSERGCAISAWSQTNGKFTLKDGAVLIARGNVNSTTNAGALSAGGNLTFDLDAPLYFDFANTNSGNGIRRWLRVGANANNSIDAIRSDIAVWGNGQRRDGTAAGNDTNSSNNPVDSGPYMSLTMIDYRLSGNNLNTVTVSAALSSEFNNTVDNFGNRGFDPYRRYSGNNAAPKINNLLPATNADKYLRAQGVVPEGIPRLEDPYERSIWTDEVLARFLRTSSGGSEETVGEGAVRSFEMEEVYEVETGTTLKGVVRYAVPDGGYLTVGDTYEITAAWRGRIDTLDTDRAHRATADDLMALPVTVTDVLPPVPAVIAYPNNNKIWVDIATEVTGTYRAGAAQAQPDPGFLPEAGPHNPEPAVMMYALVNGAKLRDADGEVLYGELDAGAGTWSFPIPEDVIGTLSAGDKIYFVLEDANANANPTVATPCHDALLTAAPYLEVSLPDLILTHTDAYIGLTRAAEIAGLDADAAAQTDGQRTALLGEIDAKATPRPGAGWNQSLDIFAMGVTPPWGEPGYYLDQEAFSAAKPKGEMYSVLYASVVDDTIRNTGHVTVLPFMEAVPYIGANDFSIPVNNAIALMKMGSPGYDDTLIRLAGAMARESLDDDFSADLVAVDVVGIPMNPVVGESYPVTFKVKGSNGDKNHSVTILALITDGDSPVLDVTTPVLVWIGDPADMPAGYILPGDYDPWDYVQAWSKEEDGDDITDRVELDDSVVDLTTVGTYPVVYTVTNDDGNTATATGIVAVGNFVTDGNYLITATSFVKKMPVTTDDIDNILDADNARAQAWMVDPLADGGLVEVEAQVSNYGGYMADCDAGTYYVEFRPVPPADGPATMLSMTIDAVVTERHELTDADDATTGIRYAIAADNVTIAIAEMGTYSGMGDEVKLRLINASFAQAWELMRTANTLGMPGGMTATDPPSGILASLDAAGVVVLKNDIPASGGQPGDAFDVVFGIKGLEDIRVTVAYTLFGQPPTITFTADPLVVPFQRGTDAHALTDSEIIDEIQATDLVDGDITDMITYTVANAPAGIHTGTPGVYSVTYRVENSSNMWTEATRALIIDDGRYMVDTDEGIIIGAKNFVVARPDFQGTTTEVLAQSRAEAFFLFDDDDHAAGTPVPAGSLYVANFDDSGWATADSDTLYPFELMVTGFDAVKDITGLVTDADVLGGGGNNDAYVIAASNFQVNLMGARALMDAGLATSLMTEAAADVKVYKLIGAAPDAEAFLAATGGFRDELNADPGYPITFGLNVEGEPVSGVTAQIHGRVSQGENPVIMAPSPVEIWIGNPANKPTGAILPTEYVSDPAGFSDDLYMVSATDYEDGDFELDDIKITYLDPATGPVNTAMPDIYTLEFSVTDSDHNTTTAPRTVIVNDGSFTVGDGRILYAQSFVTLLKDVADNPALVDTEILAKSHAKLYNADGSQITLDPSTLKDIDNPDGYGMPPAAGDFPLTITAHDMPSGDVAKDITATVVDADVMTPTSPPAFGPATYVWGSHAELAFLDAVAVAEDADPESEILSILKVDAKTIWPDNTVEYPVDTMIVNDLDDFVSTLAGATVYSLANLGIYRFAISDADGKSEPIELTINVWVDSPPSIEITERPVVLADTEAQLVDDGFGYVTRARLLQGVSIRDFEDGIPPFEPHPWGEIDYDNDPGLTIEVFDVTDGAPGTLVGGVPATRAAGAYKVVYTYTDSDGNMVSDSRLFVREHYAGEVAYNDAYVIRALSFVIHKAEVTPAHAEEQILEMAEAGVCWDVYGDSYSTYVRSLGAYAATPGDYNVVIGTDKDVTLTKNITAKVVDDGDRNNPTWGDTYGANGATCMIIGTNFRMNEADARALAAKNSSGTPDAFGFTDGFRSAIVGTSVADGGLGSVELYHRGNYAPADTVNRWVTDDGGLVDDYATDAIRHGTVYELTLRCGQDDGATVTILLFIDNSLPPVIEAPAVRIVWVGDKAGMPEGAIYVDDWDGMNFVTAYDDYYPFDLTDEILMGTLSDPDDPDSFMVAAVEDIVDLGLRDTFQEISYSVTDADHNTTVETFKVFVTKNAVIDGDYLIVAYDFVETLDNVKANGNSAAEILRLASAEAWRIKNNSLTASELPSAADASLRVRSTGDDGSGNGYMAAEGTYAHILIGVEPEAGFGDGMKNADVTGMVVDRSEIDDGFVDGVRYIVAADNAMLELGEAPGFVGLSDAARAKLIERARALSWMVDGAIADWEPDVFANQIGDATHPIKPGGTYEVTFIPKDLLDDSGEPPVFVTVTFTIDNGMPPVIEFQQAPLVLKKTAGASPLSLTDLKAFMTVMDPEDGNLRDYTLVTDAGGNPLDYLDQAKVGVWQAVYTVTDSDGNTTTATRAIVVDDGRYDIDEGDDLIIGARDYVIKVSEVDGTESQAKMYSYAEAFDIEGRPLAVAWTGAPAGYWPDPMVGSYPITWTVDGRMTEKEVTAHVVDADV